MADNATFYWTLSYGNPETIVATSGTLGPIPGADESGANDSDKSVRRIDFLSVDTGERVGGGGAGIDYYNHPIRAGQNSYERYVRFYWVFGNNTNLITGAKLWLSAGVASGNSTAIYATTKTTYAVPVTTTTNVGNVEVPVNEAGALNMDAFATGIEQSNWSKYAVLQLRTTVDAPPGNILLNGGSFLTFTAQFDEQ